MSQSWSTVLQCSRSFQGSMLTHRIPVHTSTHAMMQLTREEQWDARLASDTFTKSPQEVWFADPHCGEIVHRDRFCGHITALIKAESLPQLYGALHVLLIRGHHRNVSVGRIFSSCDNTKAAPSTSRVHEPSQILILPLSRCP